MRVGVGVNALVRQLDLMTKWRKRSEGRYVDWMISYELPSLQRVADTLDLIASQARTPTELALYVKRVDIQELIATLTVPILERAAQVMAERIVKHFGPLVHEASLLALAVGSRQRQRQYYR
jgi:hypothetical protein